MANYSKSGSGPVLLYLPGMEGTGRLFYLQEPELSRHFTVLALQLRSNSPFSYEDLARDVAEALDAEEASNAIVVGESFGGTVALHFALRYPERVRHLLLCNTFSHLRGRLRLQFAFLLLPFAFIPPGKAFREWLMRRVLASEGIDKKDIDRLLECSLSHGYGASKQRLQLIRQHDVREQLPSLSMPVTIIASARDRLLPSLQEAHFMRRKIPDCRIIVVPDGGHTCFLSSRFSLASLLRENAIL